LQGETRLENLDRKMQQLSISTSAYYYVLLTAMTFLVRNSLAGCSQGACSSYSNPNSCFGTISTSSVTQTGLNTNLATGVFSMTCGSKQSGLKDFLSQFQVQTNGIYNIQTSNIGSGDPVLQVNTCSGQVVDCNDDLSGSTRNSQLQLALVPGVQYVAAVSKYDSGSSEVVYDLTISPICTCSSFLPSQCFGSNAFTDQTGLTLAGTSDQITQTCGSGETGLKDFAAHFQVPTSGTYNVFTDNIGNSDTTMSIYTCSGTLVGCNDDVVLNSVYRSSITTSLTAGTDYVAIVSKYDSTTSDPTFDLVIQAVTSAPTPPTLQPTKLPTLLPTKLPTAPPTFAPSLPPIIPSVSPTLPPTRVPTTQPTSKSPTLTPTNQPTTLTLSPTLEPTSTATNQTEPGGEQRTGAPTTSTGFPDGFVPSNGASDIIAIGGSVGGGVAILALGVLLHRRSVRRRESLEKERWAIEEERKLREIYTTTHDFELLCQTFPLKSRESVARKLRELLAIDPKSTEAVTTFIAPHKDSYAFVHESSKFAGASPPTTLAIQQLQNWGNAISEKFSRFKTEHFSSLPPPPPISRFSRASASQHQTPQPNLTDLVRDTTNPVYDAESNDSIPPPIPSLPPQIKSKPTPPLPPTFPAFLDV
jgi:hypothetical protein